MSLSDAVAAERASPTRQDHPSWYGMDVASVATQLGVDPARGLSAAEAADRLRTHGPNKLAGGKKESGFQAFLRQYQDFMQIILLVAAVVNQLVTGEAGTTVVLAGLTVFNAVIGLRQEAKAEESVKALAQMMKTIARVRRDGQAIEIDAEELVPGDVVLVEAGNRVPGRRPDLRRRDPRDRGGGAHRARACPVGKSTEPVPGDGRAARRPDLHGLHEHVGHARPRRDDRHRAPAWTPRSATSPTCSRTPRPRRRRCRSSSTACRRSSRSIAGIALVLVVVLGLVDGESFDTLFITGVALAVAAIPTGLPAVVTALLSIGTREIATPQRDREAAAGGRDARLDLGDLLGQDRHAHAEQDDRPRDGDPRPEPVHGLRRGLQHRRARSSTSAARTSTSTRTCCRWSCAPTPCSTARA